MAATSDVTLFVGRERAAGERRVAASPDSVRCQVARGTSVLIERDAGIAAGYPDHDYADAGARLVDAAAMADSPLVARVAPPSAEDVQALTPGTVLLSFMAPHRNLDVVA